MLGLGTTINRGGFVSAAESLLLDTYSGAAVAYSLRKLSSSYSGPALQIRRASDNVEVDVSFDTNGVVSLDSPVTNVTEETSGSSQGSTTATNLGEFVADAGYTDVDSLGSADSALVQCWYDQSSNTNDATQTTAANQPKIYDSSTGVVTYNSKPAFEFTGGTSQRLGAGNYGNTAPWTILQVMGRTASAGSSESIGTLRANDNYFYNLSVNASTIRLQARANGDLNSSYVTETTNLLAYHKIDGSDSEIALNGAAVVTGTQNPNISSVIIGAGTHLVTTGDCFFQEYIIYKSDQSSNRTDIESNINTFYSIY